MTMMMVVMMLMLKVVVDSDGDEDRDEWFSDRFELKPVATTPTLNNDLISSA